MQIGRILVPYDNSENSKRAFSYALDLAKKYNSEIVVVSCILTQDQFSETSIPEEEDMRFQKQKDIVTKFLSILEMESEEAKIRCKGVILKTPTVTDALLSYSESNGIDIIVIGSRGLGGFKKLLLGSVASTISQHSMCPVLIVK